MAVTLSGLLRAGLGRPTSRRASRDEVAGLVHLLADKRRCGVESLVWTRAFIDEALRLYPPAFMIVRVAKGPDEIAGRRIAAGTVVSISPWVLHRHRARWRDPDAFDPTRFLPGAPPPARYAYMPFGAGPRICVGASSHSPRRCWCWPGCSRRSGWTWPAPAR